MGHSIKNLSRDRLLRYSWPAVTDPETQGTTALKKVEPDSVPAWFQPNAPFDFYLIAVRAVVIHDLSFNDVQPGAVV